MTPFFPFMALAPELRNTIYQHHARSFIGHIGFKLKPGLRGNREPVKNTSPLLLASRQAHSEFYPVLEDIAITSPGELIADVKDLDFRAVLKALKAFVPLGLAVTGSGHFTGDPYKVLIRLTLKDFHDSNMTSLGAWLGFCEKTGLNVCYEVEEAASREVATRVLKFCMINKDAPALKKLGDGVYQWFKDEEQRASQLQGADQDEEDEGDEVMEEGEGDVEDGSEDDDLDSDVMSSEEDFTDEELSDAEVDGPRR